MSGEANSLSAGDDQAVLAALVAERAVLVCCGSGGVGKTTTAAAIGVAAARLGRRACVVTIDPARRLADALGAAEVGNEPHLIAGVGPGELYAVMLDAKGTFDDLVGRYARDGDQAARILSNRLYRNLVSTLSGTQEYMATEKLLELHESGRFDLVVVDTPPTRNALDFLEAPRRLTGFLDNRLFRVLVAPGRVYLRAMGMATQLLVRTLGKVAGSEIVDDTIAFFQAFEGMEAGFRERARRVEHLLEQQSTGFLVVAAPRRESAAEAAYLAERLGESGHRVDLLVVNRVLEGFGPPQGPCVAPSAAATSQGSTSRGNGSAPATSTWDVLKDNLAELSALAAVEARVIDGLAEAVEPAPVLRVPELEEDVHDLEALARLARHLVGGALP
ncbi:MAG: ATPase [Acidimicrobiaceae bacterium]|nr:ATPase [Acidimicrobiaceae bacterium]